MDTKHRIGPGRLVRSGMLIAVLLALNPGNARSAESDKASKTPGGDLPAVRKVLQSVFPDESGKPAGEHLVRLSEKDECWVHTKYKWVIVNGEICQREAALEMFACPRGTKEHESIVAVSSKASTVHTGLLAVGVVPGMPVSFNPKYVGASGPEVDVRVVWTDRKGKYQEVRAQQWIRNTRTQRQIEHTWVFAGSGFWTDPSDGKEYYHGDSGDFICVSNFPTATLDLPIESSKANANLLFTPFTERIPARGTKVRLVLIPQLKKDGKNKDSKVNKKRNQKKPSR